MRLIEPEVLEFANSVGATEPAESEQIYGIYRSIFRERSYFRHPSGFLVIKISRSKKPFWGITKAIIDALNSHFEYHLVLLTSAGQGWVFSKDQTITNIGSAWHLDGQGLQYKINSPLPDSYWFLGPKAFLRKVGTGG